MKKKIVFTGGSGRFGSIIKTVKSKYKLLFPTKRELNITNLEKIRKYLKKYKPDYVVHMAGLSRPMQIHEKKINLSISLNIIGTSNIVIACSERKIKIIYFSSSYVYPGLKGNYNENDPVKPEMNYSKSKLGGECAVSMYNNSLILRLCMTEKPFKHPKALADAKTSFIYQDDFKDIFFKLINKKGIINVGGKTQTIFNFARKDNPKVKKIYLNEVKDVQFPKNSSINIRKLKKILRK
jgi:dTDP-4-dehydrorhamnose reductase